MIHSCIILALFLFPHMGDVDSPEQVFARQRFPLTLASRQIAAVLLWDRSQCVYDVWIALMLKH
jgi:hypothetical protein